MIGNHPASETLGGNPLEDSLEMIAPAVVKGLSPIAVHSTAEATQRIVEPLAGSRAIATMTAAWIAVVVKIDGIRGSSKSLIRGVVKESEVILFTRCSVLRQVCENSELRATYRYI